MSSMALSLLCHLLSFLFSPPNSMLSRNGFETGRSRKCIPCGAERETFAQCCTVVLAEILYVDGSWLKHDSQHRPVPTPKQIKTIYPHPDSTLNPSLQSTPQHHSSLSPSRTQSPTQPVSPLHPPCSPTPPTKATKTTKTRNPTRSSLLRTTPKRNNRHSNSNHTHLLSSRSMECQYTRIKCPHRTTITRSRSSSNNNHTLLLSNSNLECQPIRIKRPHRTTIQRSHRMYIHPSRQCEHDIVRRYL